MPLLTDLKPDITIQEIIRSQGADLEKVMKDQPAVVEAAERALKEGVSLIDPKVVYGEFSIIWTSQRGLYISESSSSRRLNSNVPFGGRLLSNNLETADRIVVILITLGEALEKRAGEAATSSLLDAGALDGVGEAALKSLVKQTCNYYRVAAEKEGLESSCPYSPGMKGWPINEGRPQIFDLIDAKRVGVRLNNFFEMIPCKSFTMVIGIGEDMSAKENLCANY
jgi:hypothetical protein